MKELFINKLGFFVLKYQRIVVVLFYVLTGFPAALAMFSSGVPLVFTVLAVFVYGFALIYSSSFFAASAGLARARKELCENCDPSLLYAQSRELLRHPRLRYITKSSLSLEYTTALCARGEWATARDLLLSYTPKEVRQLAGYSRFVYYHNLSVVFDHLENYESAEVYYEKSLEIMENSCKQKVFRRLCENAVLWGHAAHWERMGDPEKALGFLKEFHPANLYEEVSTELQMGNCYKKLSRIKEAAECFQFVRENGNKLHAVIRAEEQLSVLEAAMNKGGSL